MLQFQDTDNTNQDIPLNDSNLFLPQSVLNSVCTDWNINESEGLGLPGTISQEKEFNFGSFQCNCSSLPNSFSDSSWNMGFQFGGNQYTPSACCLFDQQTKKQSECVPPPILTDIEPFLNKEVENKHIDYGLIPTKPGPNSSSGDCRMLSCMQPQQPLNMPMYSSPFSTQDSLLQFNPTNSSSYSFCLESDCLDKLCSPSRNQYSACSLEQSLEMTNIRTESLARVNECNPDLSFIPLNNSEEAILNVMESDEDSDIIVEDSDTESEVSIDVGPYIGDKEVQKQAVMRCFVCNLSYSEKVEFVQVNSSFPLTFISQTPVMLKLIEIIPIDMQTSVKFENNLICKRCLNLIDTIENLEIRLVSVKKALCDFVSRSSKDICDEDWNLLQGNNEIGLEDNIVKNIEPLISKEVRSATNEILTTAQKDVVEKSLNQINENINVSVSHNNGSTILIEPIDHQDFDTNISINVCSNNIDRTFIPDMSNGPVHNTPINELMSNNNINAIGNEGSEAEAQYPKDILNNKHEIDTLNKLQTKTDQCIQYVFEPKYQCDRCGKMYLREKELTTHLKKHLGEFTEKCPDCGKGFMRKSNLDIHLRKHRNNICVNCSASFMTDIELRDHLKSCQGKQVSCTECKLVFNSEETLKSHQEKHKVESNVCAVCKKSFKHPSYLIAHMKSHSDEKPFSCEKCGRNYKNQNHLRRHAKSHENPLKCLECQQVFLNPLELKTHSRIHKEELECNICKKKITKKHFREHMKIHQKTKKKNECPICNKLVSTNLKVHMSKHAEIKGFKCEVCSSEFTFKHSLTKHMRLKHKI